MVANGKPRPPSTSPAAIQVPLPQCGQRTNDRSDVGDDRRRAPIDNAIWQIDADGGFLPVPVNVTSVPRIAERADVIIDQRLPAGTELYLLNGMRCRDD
jgi:hypothetical protein